MKNPRTLAEAAGFALFKKFLPLAFLLCTLALMVPLMLLWERYRVEAIRALACIVFLVGLLASIFTSREILFRMEEDRSVLFWDAFVHTIYGYLTFLCFIPILGPVLQRFIQPRREKNPFTSDDE